MYRDGFFCPLAKMVMGETAEVLAEQYKISRDEQDEFALVRRPAPRLRSPPGDFRTKLSRSPLEGRKGPQSSLAMSTLSPTPAWKNWPSSSPVFSKTGTITAGNSSGITDGAAAVVLASEAFVRQHNLKPLARILAATSAGVDPRIMGIGPVPALRKMAEKHDLKLTDFDLVELNEAFAAQVLACDRELHFDRDTLNVNGGAIALGHPIGCTGTRITVTLLHESVAARPSAASPPCAFGRDGHGAGVRECRLSSPCSLRV